MSQARRRARRDMPLGPPARGPLPARTHVVMALAAGLAVGVPAALIWQWEFGALLGWEVAAAVYLAWVWGTIWPLDADRTSRLAVYEDPTRPTADLILLTAAVASLLAVGFALASAGETSGSAQLLRLALGLASVVLSWAVVHTVFTLRYARIYYTGEDGGVNFKQDAPPNYRDFAYLAFTVGMTFQVSDTDVETSEMRREVLHHALLAFVFGTGILAATINLVASLTSQ